MRPTQYGNGCSQTYPLIMKRLRGRFFKGIVILLAVVGTGYISSAITQWRCEDRTALMLVKGPMQGKPFYVPAGNEPSFVIFTRVGAKFTEFMVVPMPNKRIKRVTWPDGQPMPHVDEGGRVAGVSYARIVLPFLVSVKYSSVEASLSGGGGTLYYLCLFGLPFRVWEGGGWVS
jgi:hypothetical protein